MNLGVITKHFSTEVIGGFTGVMLGVFTQGERLRGGDETS